MVDQAMARASSPRATMKDVAARAGVSLKTVSRVINAEPSVNAAMAERVRRAAQELRYQPNIGASALRRLDRRSMTIGALLEDLSNPFSAVLLRAIEEVAAERKVSVLGASLEEDPELEYSVTTAMSRHRVDGMIIAPSSHDHAYLMQELNAGVAIVFFDRPPVNLPVDAVLADSREGSRMAVQHLIDRGHRRIGFLGDLDSIFTAEERFGGYRDALAAFSIPEDRALEVRNIRSVMEAKAAVTAMLRATQPPTAFFAAQNLLTIGAVSALQELGLQHAIALVGFDDFELADLLDPGVTVVAQDTVGMGRRAAELLFERIDGSRDEPRVEVLKARMVVRGSGEIAPSA